MTSINSLPLELLLKIINLVFLTTRDDFCTIGKDAVWSMPKRTGLQMLAIQHSRPHTPVGDLLPFPDGKVIDSSEASSPGETDVTSEEPPRDSMGFYIIATNLRL
jgi:hypothetical protein